MGRTPIFNIIPEFERAAIALHILDGVKDWELLYLIAIGKNPNENNQIRDIRTKVRNWRDKHQTQLLLEDMQTRFQRIATDAQKQAENGPNSENQDKGRENVPTNTNKQNTGGKLVDYSDPANQRNKLNELVNTADDPGDALDALKVIISGQRDDKQAAREGRQVRAYLPLLCYECPLYQAREKKR